MSVEVPVVDLFELLYPPMMTQHFLFPSTNDASQIDVAGNEGVPDLVDANLPDIEIYSTRPRASRAASYPIEEYERMMGVETASMSSDESMELEDESDSDDDTDSMPSLEEVYPTHNVQSEFIGARVFNADGTEATRDEIFAVFHEVRGGLFCSYDEDD
jgi:hypothetical protein